VDGSDSDNFKIANDVFSSGTIYMTIERSSGDITANTGQWLGIAGSAGIPSFAFSTDPDTGIFSGGSGNISFSNNGVNRYLSVPAPLP